VFLVFNIKKKETGGKNVTLVQQIIDGIIKKVTDDTKADLIMPGKEQIRNLTEVKDFTEGYLLKMHVAEKPYAGDSFFTAFGTEPSFKLSHLNDFINITSQSIFIPIQIPFLNKSTSLANTTSVTACALILFVFIFTFFDSY
jgi:hypothetical protein